VAALVQLSEGGDAQLDDEQAIAAAQLGRPVSFIDSGVYKHQL
jgi:hypothetical protein